QVGSPGGGAAARGWLVHSRQTLGAEDDAERRQQERASNARVAATEPEQVAARIDRRIGKHAGRLARPGSSGCLVRSVRATGARRGSLSAAGFRSWGLPA